MLLHAKEFLREVPTIWACAMKKFRQPWPGRGATWYRKRWSQARSKLLPERVKRTDFTRNKLRNARMTIFTGNFSVRATQMYIIAHNHTQHTR